VFFPPVLTPHPLRRCSFSSRFSNLASSGALWAPKLVSSESEEAAFGFSSWSVKAQDSSRASAGAPPLQTDLSSDMQAFRDLAPALTPYIASEVGPRPAK